MTPTMKAIILSYVLGLTTIGTLLFFIFLLMPRSQLYQFILSFPGYWYIIVIISFLLLFMPGVIVLLLNFIRPRWIHIPFRSVAWLTIGLLVAYSTLIGDDVVIAVTVFLGLFATDLANEHRRNLRETSTLMRELYGLSNYITLAAGIYRESSDRVVSSLVHWVARGKSGDEIQDGIRDSRAKELVFVGRITWNQYFPGVLSRLVTIRHRIQHQIRNGGNETKVLVLDADCTVPNFVVSRVSDNEGGFQRGRLLVGNPIRQEGTDIYGFDLSREQQLVDFYNFVYDTYMNPSPVLLSALTGLTVEGRQRSLYDYLRVKRPTLTDGLQQVLKMVKFKREVERQRSVEHGEKDISVDRLIDLAANSVAEALETEYLLRAREREGREFIMNMSEAREVCRNFLRELHVVGYLHFQGLPEGGMLELSDQAVSCAEFFTIGPRHEGEG